MSDTITETIYVVKDRDQNCRYVGRTRLPLARRLQKHSEQLRTDWLACPLYRFMHQENATFNQDDWTIEPLATVTYPDANLFTRGTVTRLPFLLVYVTSLPGISRSSS